MTSARAELDLEFRDITEENVNLLRQMNLGIFPVRYHDKFYKDVVSTPPAFTQFAYCRGSMVGAICSRIEQPKKPGDHRKLYIMTLGVLAAYRRRGIGSQLLNHGLSNLARYPDIGEIYLHVQTSNEEAVAFYEKWGFKIKERIPNYYKRIDPPDCFVLQKKLHSA